MVLVYINENGGYNKFYIRDDNRLMCTKKNGEENMILPDVSDEFDAAINNGCLHFIMQGTGGELIYLKREEDIWRKFDILKSKRGIKKIHKLRLIASQNKLCAFYIMEHGGQNLFVKHRFTADMLYEEPEVLGICSDGKIYSLSETESSVILFFKDSQGVFKKVISDKDFNIKSIEECRFKNEITSINTLFFEGCLYALCTVKRKNSTALIFFDTQNEDDAKIISFGMPKNSTGELIASAGEITALWEENGGIIYSQYIIGDNSFSKPRPLARTYKLSRIREDNKSEYTFSGKCAFYNFFPQIPQGFKKEKINSQRRTNMSPNNFENKNITLRDNDFILEKLKEIQEDIKKMGNSLKEMCVFMDRLTDFKKEAEKGADVIESDGVISEISGSEGLNQINEENMRLFENTYIDEVLPQGDEKQ